MIGSWLRGGVQAHHKTGTGYVEARSFYFQVPRPTRGTPTGWWSQRICIRTPLILVDRLNISRVGPILRRGYAGLFHSN